MTRADYVMYFLVRKDLGMHTGMIAAYCSHAAEYLFTYAPKNVRRLYRANGYSKIVLKVRDLDALRAAEAECSRAVIPTYAVEDTERMRVPAESIAVLGVGPVHRSDTPPLISSLSPLL